MSGLSSVPEMFLKTMKSGKVSRYVSYILVITGTTGSFSFDFLSLFL